MQVRITGRHVEVTDQVREYLEEKASKLPRHYDRIHSIDVVLDHESEQFRAEIVLHADQKQTFVAHSTGNDTFALIDDIIEKMERQLTRYKEKKRSHKHEHEHEGDVAPTEET